MLVLPKSKNQCVQDEAQVRHQLCTCLLLQGGKRAVRWMRSLRGMYEQKVKHEHMKKLRTVPACCFLYPLIAIQDAFEQFSHEGLEVSVRRLADHPVCIAAEGPAGDGADQGLLVAQTLDEVGDELRQVRHHALHTAWKDKKVLYI